MSHIIESFCRLRLRLTHFDESKSIERITTNHFIYDEDIKTSQSCI